MPNQKIKKDSPLVQKQKLDRLYQAWSDAPWSDNETAFGEIDDYLRSQDLTLSEVVRVRNPDIDVDAAIATDFLQLGKFLRD